MFAAPATDLRQEISGRRSRPSPTTPRQRLPDDPEREPDPRRWPALLRCAPAFGACVRLPRTAWPRWPDPEPFLPNRAATLHRCAGTVPPAWPRADTLRSIPPAGTAAGTYSSRRKCSRDDPVTGPDSPRSAAVGTDPAFRSGTSRLLYDWKRVRSRSRDRAWS